MKALADWNKTTIWRLFAH